MDRLNKRQLPTDKRGFNGVLNLANHAYSDYHQKENGLSKPSADHWRLLYSEYGFPQDIKLSYLYGVYRVFVVYDHQRRDVQHCYKGFAFGQVPEKQRLHAHVIGQKTKLFRDALMAIECPEPLTNWIDQIEIKPHPLDTFNCELLVNKQWTLPKL